jgi:hypothetical protein
LRDGCPSVSWFLPLTFHIPFRILVGPPVRLANCNFLTDCTSVGPSGFSFALSSTYPSKSPSNPCTHPSKFSYNYLFPCPSTCPFSLSLYISTCPSTCSFSLSVYIFTCPFTTPYTYLSNLSFNLPVCLLLCLSGCPSICLYVRGTVCLSIHLLFLPPISLSTWRSTFVPTSLSAYNSILVYLRADLTIYSLYEHSICINKFVLQQSLFLGVGRQTRGANCNILLHGWIYATRWEPFVTAFGSFRCSVTPLSLLLIFPVLLDAFAKVTLHSFRFVDVERSRGREGELWWLVRVGKGFFTYDY